MTPHQDGVTLIWRHLRGACTEACPPETKTHYQTQAGIVYPTLPQAYRREVGDRR